MSAVGIMGSMATGVLNVVLGGVIPSLRSLRQNARFPLCLTQDAKQEETRPVRWAGFLNGERDKHKNGRLGALLGDESPNDQDNQCAADGQDPAPK